MIEGAGRKKIALGIILAFALWLRLDGIGFGLDFRDPQRGLFANLFDERGMVEAMQDGLLRGNLDPGGFLHRGPAAFLVFGAVDCLLVGVKSLSHEQGWTGVTADLERNPALLHLVHRCVSAVAGVLTVLLLMRLVRREFDERSALLSGSILAVAYLHVRDSHFGLVDVLWALATLAALDQMLLTIRDPRRGRYFRSGLLAGIATATKYFSGLLGAHLLLAHLFARSGSRARSSTVPGHGRLVLALAACPLGFLLLFPGLPWAARNLPEIFAFHTVDTPELDGQSQLTALLFHLRYSLAVGLGEPVFALALVGSWITWKRGAAGRFWMLSILLLVPIFLAITPLCLRYGIPMLVALTVPAGLALSALLERLPRGVRPVVTALVLLPSLVRSVAFDRIAPRQDTRVEMLSILRARGTPPEQVMGVGLFGLPFQSKRVQKDPWPFTYYLPSNVRQRLVGVLNDPPLSILWDLSLDPEQLPGKDKLQDLVRTRYREVLRLDPRRGDPAQLPPPDVHEVNGGNPGLMVNYTQPWTVSRPGPALILYELRDP